ncbi:hypothetical protein GCM10022408_34080 [Hymenobacter fastidiosus]|uniref:TonB C-terminal domain-containing protein n=1 Tax=Hymenobacter fastidiosus TaxID=486264 RepID=A0ABP7SWY4_9BACT
MVAVSVAFAARAQQPAPTKAPVVLKPGHMRAQRNPAANRPDVPPRFPGGATALSAFFQQQIQYPEAARVNKVAGNVLTSFTIEADGRVTNPRITTGLSPECDAEALRVLGLLPPWQPATRKGQPVPIQVQLPVPFGNSTNLQVGKSKTKVKFE